MASEEPQSLAALKTFAAKNKVTLVDFHATWCGPCKAIAPYLVEQAKTNGVPLAKVDVDIAADAAAAYGVQAMPTFKVIDPAGLVLGEVVGGGKANVDKMIDLAKTKL